MHVNGTKQLQNNPSIMRIDVWDSSPERLYQTVLYITERNCLGIWYTGSNHKNIAIPADWNKTQENKLNLCLPSRFGWFFLIQFNGQIVQEYDVTVKITWKAPPVVNCGSTLHPNVPAVVCLKILSASPNHILQCHTICFLSWNHLETKHP